MTEPMKYTKQLQFPYLPISLHYWFRWKDQSAAEHVDHMIHVAYRGMLDAVSDGRQLPRKALRGFKYSSIQEYASAVAAALNGKTSDHACNAAVS